MSSDRVHRLFALKFTTHDIHFKTMLLGLSNERMLLVAENLDLQIIYAFIQTTTTKRAIVVRNKCIPATVLVIMPWGVSAGALQR
jgi:hypothetical protein